MLLAESNPPRMPERARFERELEALGLGPAGNIFAESEPGIIGNDGRQDVTDTRPIPYRWICSVTFEKDGTTMSGGSGVLISNRHVLTAAHVVRAWNSGPNPQSLMVYPGRSYGSQSLGLAVDNVRTSSEWLDFGLVTLEDKVPDELMWWGHPSSASDLWNEGIISIKELQRTPFRIFTAGFPGARDKQRRRMISASGDTFPTPFGATFFHSADTTQGQSGSPIWTVRNDRLVLLGIITGAAKDGSRNRATLLHGSLVRRTIDQWLAADRPKPAKPPKRRMVIEQPYRWVCRVEVSDNSLGRPVGFGTAVLISDRHALTSASVIHAFARDPMRYTVRVTPGYEFGKESFEGSTASRGRVAPAFSPDSTDSSANYGLLTLNKPVGLSRYAAIGNAPLGYWGGKLHALSTSITDLKAGQVKIAAYSRSSGGGGRYQLLRIARGKLMGVDGGRLRQGASSRLDAPGAPIWVERDGRGLLAGITSPLFSASSGANLGCHLGEEARANLNRWINEDYDRR